MARSWIIGSGMLLTLAVAQLALAQPSPGASRVCPTACTPNVPEYGYFKTTWRQWPGESHLSETNPRQFGSEVLPTPEGHEQLPVPPSMPNQPSPSTSPGRGTVPAPRTTILPPQAPVAVPDAPASPKTPVLPKTPAPPADGGLPGLPVEPQHAPSVNPFEGGTKPNPAPKSDEKLKIQTPSKSRDARYERPEQGLSSSEASNRDAGASPMVQGTVVALVDTSSSSVQGAAASRIEAATSSGRNNNIEAAGYTTVEQAARVEITDGGIQVPPVALNGYCPVELIRNGVWKQGDLRWTVVHNGYIYRLSGPEQRAAFLADPSAFIPACGGNDPVLAAERNLRTPGQTTCCALYEGRLYMFSNAATQTQFNREPSRYAEAR
ncbi:MAG: hypothetical protein LLF97_07435 [Planctomycetaceae bacterium]|nr:hypothetical protein [Planctomycetaceae bacterium]